MSKKAQTTSTAALSTHAVESGVIDVPYQKAWEHVIKLDFKWWNLVANSSLVTGSSNKELDSTIKLTFKDGASWVIAIRELSSISNSVTFEVIESQPESLVTSAIHTVSLKKVSAGASSGGTFVEWVSDFSNDCTPEVIADSSFKRREAINDLGKASSP